MTGRGIGMTKMLTVLDSNYDSRKTELDNDKTKFPPGCKTNKVRDQSTEQNKPTIAEDL